jgi:transcriptional regulator with XRE-family HTH domain
VPKTSSFGQMTADERSGLGKRIREMVEVVGSNAEAAAVAGISVDQLSRLTAGTSSPSFLAVGRLAERTGFSLNWVMSGRGPRYAASAAKATDPELLGRVVDAIARVYREEKVNLPDVELGRLAGEEYDAIVAATEDADERTTMVKLVAEKHRRALRTEHPASRKRGA